MTTPSTSAQGPDLRREEQLRIQAVGAAISRREWWEVEQAYNAIRDEFDRRPTSPSPAALPASPSGVRVKPLEWHPFSAETVIGRYDINDQSGAEFEREREGRLPFLLAKPRAGYDRFSTLDEAKSAAQADYEARIRSALLEGSE